MRRSKWAAFAGLVWGALSSPELAAQTLPVALTYSAPEQCPDAAAFWQALTSRTRRVTSAEEGRSQALLRLVLRQRGQRILGRLEIIRNDLATEPRYVEAEACTDVVQALALTAALSLDPDALTRPPPPPEPEPETGTEFSAETVTEPDTAKGTEFDSATGTETELPRSEPETARAEFVEVPYDAPDAMPSIPIEWETALGAQLVGALPVDPVASFGLAGALTFRGERAADLSPTLSIGAAALRSDLFGDDRQMRFSLYTLMGQACPVRGKVGRFEIRPCLGVLAGLLDASGQNISDPTGTQRVWASIGGAVELEYSLTTTLILQLTVAGHAPLRAQRYSQGMPQSEVARTPVFLPWVGLGLAHLL